MNLAFSHVHRGVCAIVAGILGVTAVVRAQVAVIDSPTTETGTLFGIAPILIDDVTGDSVKDIVVPSPNASSYEGRVYIYSGADYSLVRTLQSPNAETGVDQYTGSQFGTVALQTGDLGGTAGRDLYVAAPRETVSGQALAGRGYVFDPSTGSLIRTFQSPSPQAGGLFGGSMATIADQDADLTPDLVIGANGEGVSATGIAYVFSGDDASTPIAALAPPSSQANLLWGTVYPVGDQNNDSVSDFAVSAMGEDIVPQTASGAVYLRSGADTSPIRRIADPVLESYDYFGNLVRPVPDLNADGKPDLAIVSVKNNTSGAFQGDVSFFSSLDGAPLGSVSLFLSGFFGTDVIGIDDIDGDGLDDVAIGGNYPSFSSFNDAGLIMLYSSADLSLVSTVSSPEPFYVIDAFSFPVRIADQDGDGRDDLLVGAPKGNGGRGRVYLANLAADLLEASPALDFRTRVPGSGPSNPLSFTVKNVGPAVLTITGVSIAGANPADFSLDSNPTGTPLQNNETVSVPVRFTPQALGARSATVTVTTDDFTSGTIVATLSGTGAVYPNGPAGTMLYIAGGSTVMAVEVATGNRTIIADSVIGAGPALDTLGGVVIESTDTLLLMTRQSFTTRPIRMNRNTGDRAYAGPPAPGFGSTNGADCTLESPTSLVALTGNGNPKLLRYDLTTTTTVQTVSSFSPSVGTGTSFYDPTCIAVRSDGAILDGESIQQALFSVDPVTGNRTVVAGGFYSGYGSIRDIDVLSDSQLVMVQDYSDSVYQVNKTTGAKTVISDNSGPGTGPTLSSYTALHVAVGPGDAIYVLDCDFGGRLVQVDRVSGNRTLISQFGTLGSGPSFGSVFFPSTNVQMDIDGLVVVPANVGHDWHLLD